MNKKRSCSSFILPPSSFAASLLGLVVLLQLDRHRLAAVVYDLLDHADALGEPVGDLDVLVLDLDRATGGGQGVVLLAAELDLLRAARELALDVLAGNLAGERPLEV